jgi:hypothetical protein
VLTFKEEGNNSLTRQTSDLIVKIEEVSHTEYRRNGNDLIFTYKVDLIDALKSEPIIFVSYLDYCIRKLSTRETSIFQLIKSLHLKLLDVFPKKECLSVQMRTVKCLNRIQREESYI